MKLSDLSELGKPKTCDHCCGPMLGYASVGDKPLCHPDDGIDCYRLVTVYKHAMPCPRCAAQRATADGLAHVLSDDWAQKIETARAAREMGRDLRADKPASFRRSVGHHPEPRP